MPRRNPGISNRGGGGRYFTNFQEFPIGGALFYEFPPARQGRKFYIEKLNLANNRVNNKSVPEGKLRIETCDERLIH